MDEREGDKMRNEFKIHKLNDDGLRQCEFLAQKFTELLDFIDSVGLDGREKSIAFTKLEEASFFAKKSIAVKKEYQL